MPLHPLYGHLAARQQLARSFERGSLPQLIAVVGPDGVGKQRLALWLSQLVLCERPGTEPCGACRPCRQVLELAHPDLHWIAPVLRPKAADGDKQVEELAEAQAELVAERRTQPLYGPPEGLAGHFVATARLIQKRAALTPAVGARKVFVIGHAERLVPQESSADAANALLKLFEEPPADTVIVLTAPELTTLLPTIRSRAGPLRVGRLSDGEVAAFLKERLVPAPTESDLAGRVERAQGSIGRAIADPSESGSSREAAHRLLEAVLAGPGARAERALKQGSFAARGEFTATLDALGATLADAARKASGHPARGPLPKGLPGRIATPALVEAAGLVAEARESAQGNVNPQLLLGVLLEDLAAELCA